jgi:hypothetical protein
MTQEAVLQAPNINVASASAKLISTAQCTILDTVFILQHPRKNQLGNFVIFSAEILRRFTKVEYDGRAM